MRFDWYQATIEDDPRTVVSTLAKLGDEVKPADGDARRWRYRQGWAVLKRGHVVARCFAGGNGDKPHALATSDDTDVFVDLVRSEWEGRHLVTRMDSAQDFFDEDAYDRLKRVARQIAKKHRLRFASIGDELCSEAGRTQYIGSPASDYRGRLYEKGFEVVAKALAQNPNVRIGPEAVETVFNSVTGEYVRAADWVRLELQARPQGEDARRLASSVSPEDAWTFTNWSHKLAEQVMEVDLERAYVRQKKVSKDEEAFRWMCKQYAGMLTRLKGDLGDWTTVGLEIGSIVSEMDRKG